jgi:hypothetical protein
VPDEEERPRDASSAAGSGSPERPDAAGDDLTWVNASAPDDIRELAPDISAYHREQRALRRRARVRRLVGRASVAPLSLTVAGLFLAAVVTTLLTVMEPRTLTAPPSAAPLASPSAAAGTIHGLLPNGQVTDVNGNLKALRSLRPAVLALVAPGCNCATALNSLAGAAASERLPLGIVTSPDDPQATSLVGQMHNGVPPAYYTDSNRVLASKFTPGGVSLIVVDRTGVIRDIDKPAVASTTNDLTAMLQQLLARTERVSG